MGVPGLFAWLRRRYPLIVQQIDKAEAGPSGDDEQACDNLYIGEQLPCSPAWQPDIPSWQDPRWCMFAAFLHPPQAQSCWWLSWGCGCWTTVGCHLCSTAQHMLSLHVGFKADR